MMRHRQAWTSAPETAGGALAALDPESNEREAIVTYSDPIEDIVTATLRDGGGTWTRDLVPVGRPVHMPWAWGLPDAWAVGGSMPGYTRAADYLPDTLPDAIGKALQALIEDGAAYVGTWLEKGVIYIDAVDLIEDTAEAIALGRERGELAIYNLRTEETIDLTKGA